ncbi:hypothetical protein [Derxia gummosa]|uniref:Uncharacterized protein n=1 Tax=Derxia gummosa DSM 723 TaxID=1121388 RepID=A0A8B6XC04_9BURK|nr:hypothetical protein [Derxia gummosa]
MDASTQPPSRKKMDIARLHAVIEDMDAMAQDGFSRISSLVEVLLCAMESTTRYPSNSSIAHTLLTIQSIADDNENGVNSLAEDMGCNFIDDRQRARWNAEEKAEERRPRMATTAQAGVAHA